MAWEVGMPGEEVATEIVGKSFESMGMAAGFFLLLLFIVAGLFWLASIWLKAQAAKKPEKKDTPKPVETRGPTETWWKGMSASMIRSEDKQKTDETQDATIQKLEATIKEEFKRLDGRVDELFRVEGQHRNELKAEIKEVLSKLEKHAEKSGDKNEKQDTLINGLRESFATLQGMIAAKRSGSSGVTQFMPEQERKKD